MKRKRDELFAEVFYQNNAQTRTVLADYLEENNIELSLAAGLRFCLKHSIWPTQKGQYLQFSHAPQEALPFIYCLCSGNYVEIKDESPATVVARLGALILAIRAIRDEK